MTDIVNLSVIEETVILRLETPVVQLRRATNKPILLQRSGVVGPPGPRTTGFSLSITGRVRAMERFPLGKAPYSMLITAADCAVTSLVPAAADTLFVMKRGTLAVSATVGTFTFLQNSTVAVASISSGGIAEGEITWIEGPAIPDANLSDVNFIIKTGIRL